MGADHHREFRHVTDVRRGPSRAALMATLAMLCVLAACGEEPRVDEVRVSITAPTLAGHRHVGASDAPSLHDADGDRVDVTTSQNAHRPVAIDAATIAAGDQVATAEHGGAVVAVSGEAQIAPRPHDSADVRPPVGSAGSDDPAATGAGSVMADIAHSDDAHGDDAHGDDAHGDDAHGGGAPIDNAHGADFPGADAAGLASPGVESGTATAGGGDGAHGAADEATDGHPATAWVAAAEVLARAPTDADRTAVMTAVHRAWSADIAARRAPDDASLLAAVSASRAGVERIRALSELADLAARGHRSIADPTIPNVLQVTEMKAALPAGSDDVPTDGHYPDGVIGGFMVATVCIVVTDQLWGPSPSADHLDGGDVVGVDVVPIGTVATRSVMRWGLERADEVWVVSDVVVDWIEILDTATATQGCAQ